MIIDRIEGEIIVVEDNDGRLELHKNEFVLPVKEGDVIFFENGKYVCDKEKTEQRRKEISLKMKKLGL